jgi:hypothetical protein
MRTVKPYHKPSGIMPNMTGTPLRNGLAAACLIAYSCTGTPAQSQATARITQRRVNDASAAIERCRRGLLETPGLRRKSEPLPAYLYRMAAVLPGENVAVYRSRCASYVEMLSRASEDTAFVREVPRLVDSGAANSGLWRRAARDFSYLPKRIEHVRNAWRAASASQSAANTHAFGAEILQTLLLMIDADNNLRDARP